MLIVSPAHFSRHIEPGPGAEVEWRSSADGRQVDQQGRGALSAPAPNASSAVLSLLPDDPEVILALPPLAVSWHRVVLPKAPQSKLRAVLEGLLEDEVLSDTDDLHFALEPGSKPGKPTWVAACSKRWLQGWLTALDQAGHPVTRIVPAVAPLLHDGTAPPQATGAELAPVVHWVHAADQTQWVATIGPRGVSCVPLPDAPADAMHMITGLNRYLLSADSPDDNMVSDGAGVLWTADPSVSALAEAALQQKVSLMTANEWLLRATQNRWNLAQFDFTLSSRARAGQRWREGWRQWLSAPQWRPARWGATALLLISLIGLNLTAWQEARAVDAKKAYASRLFKQTFPTKPMVLEPELQMQRELVQARQTKGQLGPGDFEAMLTAAAQAMPEGMASPMELTYNSGQVQISGWSGPDAQVEALERALAQKGWRVVMEADKLIMEPGEN